MTQFGKKQLKNHSCERVFLLCTCYWYNFFRWIFFIPCDCWKILIFIKFYCNFQAFLIRHAIVVFETSVLKEARTLHYLQSNSTMLILKSSKIKVSYMIFVDLIYRFFLFNYFPVTFFHFVAVPHFYFYLFFFVYVFYVSFSLEYFLQNSKYFLNPRTILGLCWVWLSHAIWCPKFWKSVEMVKNDICFGGARKPNARFFIKCAPKNVPMP